MKWRTIGTVAGLAAVGAVAVLWLGRPEPIAVEVIEVARGPVAETVTNTRAGTVEACQRAKLAPPAGGQIARLPVKKGDKVEPGQVLLELWNDDIRAQLAVTERDAAATRARREETCVAARVARRESNRLAQLVERKLVSGELADRADGEADAREAACRAPAEQDPRQPGPHRGCAGAARTHAAARAVRRDRGGAQRGRRCSCQL